MKLPAQCFPPLCWQHRKFGWWNYLHWEFWRRVVVYVQRIQWIIGLKTKNILIYMARQKRRLPQLTQNIMDSFGNYPLGNLLITCSAMSWIMPSGYFLLVRSVNSISAVSALLGVTSIVRNWRQKNSLPTLSAKPLTIVCTKPVT